jgi:adenylate cyclase
MKSLPLWTLSLPIIALTAALQITLDTGESGELDSRFLREKIYPLTRSISGALTNVKFRLRGPETGNRKVVIVEADDFSLNLFGRWPWHREVYAAILDRITELRSKSIGLDVVFSEPEDRIHPRAYELIQKYLPKKESEFRALESDPKLADAIARAKDHLVLGYSYDGACQPRYEPEEVCPLDQPGVHEAVEDEIGKFAIRERYPFPKETLYRTSLRCLYQVIPNIELFRTEALRAGTFNIDPDPDGYIRRYPLFHFSRDLIFPSLAVAMAELARNDEIRIDFKPNGLLKKVYFSKDPDHPIDVTPLGYMDLNFRGPYRPNEPVAGYEPYTYVPVWELLGEKGPNGYQQKSEKQLQELFRDAHVLFGATALGIYDMRAFPFDSNTPGVDGHATAFDNLMKNDMLRSASALHLSWLPATLIVVLGLLFAFLFATLEATPSIIVFVGALAVMGYVDINILFKNHINFSSVFLLIELFLIFLSLMSVRYILEEKKKKFVREAFSKYLAPQVVDLVLDDPSKLTVGGERKDITILFSDLRGFTHFSENMDPKVLTQFLNEYLSEMTEIIFQHEGTLDKYIGDAIMAFWGAPLEQKDHVERAFKAAVAMKKRLDEIAPTFKERYGIDVSAGIGINSGVVSVGNMGSKRIFEYTVIGDHVNLASRLESLTRLYGGDILSTELTREKLPETVRGNFHTRILDSVIVKGKTQAVDLIQISEEAFDPELLQAFTGAREAFKSRQWETARTKFRLASEIERKTHGRPDPVSEIYIHRCDEFEKDPPPPGWDGTIELRAK